MKKTVTTFLLILFALSSNLTKAQSTHVTFYTTMGDFMVGLYDVNRPITTTNFLGLVNAHFYDGVIFHRVISGFMIQGGDPTGTGFGGTGNPIQDELSAPNYNLQKVIAMANSGPNTGESQFFINLVNNTFLNPNYPVFGIVLNNFSVVQAIGIVPTDSTDRPLTDVVMDSVRVTSVSAAGISETNKQALEIDVFPNPITNKSIISINSNTTNKVKIAIYNHLGEMINCSTKKLFTGINTFSFEEIKANAFAQGMYYLVVNDGTTIWKQKLIIGTK